ncbi:hypothetical protein BDZ94DRAFT_1162704 [Collybia nuda]|uniref:Uncharacterized protein n=1 Tax=Collybia nuda TaxID=64659 RepID=A0A9P5YAF3_9AGAR|nr:hypothetical protein BDZ94DRAFT_1162704 [Collybia nuda]
MSTASLPSYVAPSFSHIPVYSAEPHQHEQRIALADRLRPRPSGNFVKESRSGGARLRLTAQEDNVALPTYGSQGSVEGTVELSKIDGVTSVEVKIEGRLKLKEVAEGGTTSAKLCLDTTLLWIKDSNNTACPKSLQFALSLPPTFTYEDKIYPLPPTFDVKLSGLPGFTATIDYSVSAIIYKPHSAPGLVPSVKSSRLGISIGSVCPSTVTTPFIYYPRTRPAVPIPSPLVPTWRGFVETPEWKLYESEIHARKRGLQNIATRLYIPTSRIFCISQPIPFHLVFESSALSLASFLPLSPTPARLGTSRVTQIQIMRQSSVDVRNSVMEGAKTDMWRVDCIGEGYFKHAGDGPTWISFSGEIIINDTVKVPGFRAAGLTIKDCILFSMAPYDLRRAGFEEVRQVIPVRLTTDVWTADGRGIGARGLHNGSDYSVPSTPEELEDAQPGLHYNS